MKRIVDLVFASAGVVLLSPGFVLIATLIRIGDGRPVFFRQQRIGRDGVPFTMWKFRTMRPDAELHGGQLTAGQDPRITPIGRWLRSTKLDELPQLFNVLRGEMSLVGPRPEVPEYVNRYTDAQRAVLKLKPGITDPASISFRNEAALLGQAADPDEYYTNVVMPEKIKINLAYSERATSLSDLKVLLQTMRVLAHPQS